MENQTQLRSNYLALKNANECKCPQTMKCTVDDRISAVLDSYYVRFQNLSKEKNQPKIPEDLLSAFSKGTITNQLNQFHSTNDSQSSGTETDPKLRHQISNVNEIEIQQKLLTVEAEANNATEKILYTGESSQHSKPPSHLAEPAARPFRCSECGMAFKRNLHLKRHFMVTHTSKKNFSCSNCGKSFSRKDYLDKHIATHEKRKFKLELLQQGIVVRTKMNVKSSK